jgi:hypothetical protein
MFCSANILRIGMSRIFDREPMRAGGFVLLLRAKIFAGALVLFHG